MNPYYCIQLYNFPIVKVFFNLSYVLLKILIIKLCAFRVKFEYLKCLSELKFDFKSFTDSDKLFQIKMNRLLSINWIDFYILKRFCKKKINITLQSSNIKYSIIIWFISKPSKNIKYIVIYFKSWNFSKPLCLSEKSSILSMNSLALSWTFVKNSSSFSNFDSIFIQAFRCALWMSSYGPSPNP